MSAQRHPSQDGSLGDKHSRGDLPSYSWFIRPGHKTRLISSPTAATPKRPLGRANPIKQLERAFYMMNRISKCDKRSHNTRKRAYRVMHTTREGERGRRKNKIRRKKADWLVGGCPVASEKVNVRERWRALTKMDRARALFSLAPPVCEGLNPEPLCSFHRGGNSLISYSVRLTEREKENRK